MPKPNPGESKKDYISRFMSSAESKSDFPDEKQRLAVAYSMFEKRNSTLPYGQEHPWPKMYKCTYIEPGVELLRNASEAARLGLTWLRGQAAQAEDVRATREAVERTERKVDAIARKLGAE